MDIIKWARQREKEEWHNIHGGLLNADMGLGKTLMILSLIVSDRLLEEKQGQGQGQMVGPTLIVAPVTLLDPWKQECQKFFGFNLRVFIFYRDKMKPKTLFDEFTFQELSHYHIVITNYDTIENQAKKCLNLQKQSLAIVGPKLLFLPWYRIVADESHRLANPKSSLFKGMMELKSKRKWSVTGTPFRNYDLDIYAQMKFLGFSAIEDGKKWSAQVFHDFHLKKVIYSLTIEEAKIQLPPLHDITISCSFMQAEQNLYDKWAELTKHAYRRLKEKKSSKNQKSMSQVLKALIRLRQICVSSHLLPVEDIKDLPLPNLSSKLLKTQDLLYNIIPSNKKVIIFSNWTKVLLAVQKLLSPETNLLVHSKLKLVDREIEFNKFRNQPTLRFLLMTYGVGQVGLNLTVAQYVIFMEPWFSAVVGLQAKKRIHRIGQTQECFCYHFIVKNSIEESILKICAKKIEMAKKYLEDKNGFDTQEKEEQTTVLEVLNTHFFSSTS